MKDTKNIEVFINESEELEEARQDGIDLWALWHNLQRTPAERLRRHYIAWNTVQKLRKAKFVIPNKAEGSI